MNSYIKYFTKAYILCFLFLWFSSCTKFLEEKPKSILTTVNFYQNESQAKSAVNAIYASIQSESNLFDWQILTLTDLATDNFFCDPAAGNASFQGMSKLNYDASNANFSSTWNGLYKTIERANAAIADIPHNIQNRDQLIGQAKFLRGLAYFYLVRFFGAVPVITQLVTNYEQSFQIAENRSPMPEVYQQIIQDFQDAENLLPDSWGGADAGRATSGAARSFLAKVYLTMAGHPLLDRSKWGLAAKTADSVIKSGQYALDPQYLDVFGKNLSSESIFSAQMVSGYGVNAGGSLLGINTMPRNAASVLGNTYRGNALVRPTPSLYNSFDTSDLRRKFGFFTHISNADGTKTAYFAPHVYKYIEPDLMAEGQVLNDGSRNFPVIRYAEILLIYAEASNEANGGPDESSYEAINKVRKRAGLPDLTQGLSQAGFRDSVYLERRHELFCEGHRWFDLVRTGRLVSAVSQVDTKDPLGSWDPNNSGFIITKDIKARDTLYPIPQGQVNLVQGLTQNEGY